MRRKEAFSSEISENLKVPLCYFPVLYAGFNGSELNDQSSLEYAVRLHSRIIVCHRYSGQPSLCSNSSNLSVPRAMIQLADAASNGAQHLQTGRKSLAFPSKSVLADILETSAWTGPQRSLHGRSRFQPE